MNRQNNGVDKERGVMLEPQGITPEKFGPNDTTYGVLAILIS